MSKFTRERDLYKKVISKLVATENPVINIIERNGKTLYLVGETHMTRNAVDYVHEKIVPKIISNPDNWMLIREGLHSFDNAKKEDLLNIGADIFYFAKLSKVLDIPAEDAIKSPLNPDVKKYILDNSNLTEIDIDSWYFVTFMDLNRNLPATKRQEAERELVEKLGRGKNYILDTLQHAQKSDGALLSRRIHEILLPTWNRYARQTLDNILTQNSKRRKFLVSVGTAHLPAFSDDYSYIG